MTGRKVGGGWVPAAEASIDSTDGDLYRVGFQSFVPPAPRGAKRVCEA